MKIISRSRTTLIALALLTASACFIGACSGGGHQASQNAPQDAREPADQQSGEAQSIQIEPVEQQSHVARLNKHASAKVEQPQSIPGNFKIDEQPLPDLQKIVESRGPGSMVYGLYTWSGEYKTHRDSIRRIGWKSIRMGGPFDDEIMRMVVEDNVEVMKTLGRQRRNDFDSDEAFISAYLEVVVDFLERYGPQGTFFKDHPNLPHRPIMAVEIWNEPNFQYMISDREPRAEVEAEREALYAKVLKAAHDAINPRWKDVAVVGFSAGGASAGDIRFIRRIHQNVPEIVKSYDILSTHPYVDPAPPEAYSIRPWGQYSIAGTLAENRRTLEEVGAADKPVWFTEIGWPVSKADGGHFDTAEGKVMVSPMLQAAYVCRLYAYALRLNVDRVHIMFATDTDNFNAGFFLRDKSWRPSATAVAVMTDVLSNPRLVGALSDGQNGYHAYQFNTGDMADAGRDVIMAWNVAGPQEVELQVNMPKVEVIEMLGHRRTIESTGGKIKLTVGPLPLYVRQAN